LTGRFSLSTQTNKSNMKTTKIKVIKPGYFAGGYHEAGAEIDLTERQFDCVKRRNREFEILEGEDKGKVISGGADETDGGENAGSEDENTEGGKGAPAKVTVKDLKAALDEKGIEYPANAKKDELQALLDAPEGGEETKGGEDLM
jgi:hypothetical protein